MHSPILIIGYNRPKNMKRMLSRIFFSPERKVYISIDGPRSPEDELKVLEVQNLVKSFVSKNPHLEIQIRFSELNLGCKNGVSSAIDWAFEHEDSLIILEDDVVISDEFFVFTDHYLKMYESDNQIWHINGFSPLLPPYLSDTSYFTKFAHVWGWATWKDRWEKYDRELDKFQVENLSQSKSLEHQPLSKASLSFFEENLIACKNGFDTWDFQWQFTIWFNGGLALSPGERLSGNTGFGPNASHTKFAGYRGLNLLPQRDISNKYRISEPSKQSEFLEQLHELIIFGIGTGNSEISFNIKTKVQIFWRTFPKFIELKYNRLLKFKPKP